jgi:hypothetical protein
LLILGSSGAEGSSCRVVAAKETEWRRRDLDAAGLGDAPASASTLPE